MPDLTKLIVGVYNTWESVKLFVAGTPGDPAPPIMIYQRGVTNPIAEYYDSGEGGWEITLAEGDYILRMEMPEEDWFSGTLPISVVDQADVNFVFHGPETESPNAHETVAWTDSSALVGSDPKDPWPPPGQNTLELPSTPRAWFDTELHTARVSLPTPKAA